MDRRAWLGVLAVATAATVALHVGLKQRAPRVLVRHEVGPLKQSADMNCWAAVYAMMLGWRQGAALSEEQAVRAIGEPWITFQQTGAGLPGGSELEFVRAAGLVAEPPASYEASVFLDLLRDTGPLWIITGDGISSHARLLIGATGDGSHDSLDFVMLDPATGKEENVPVRTFYEEFEREASTIVASDVRVDLRWQIIHWPAAGKPALSTQVRTTLR